MAGVIYVRNGGQFGSPQVVFPGDAAGSGWIDLPAAGGFVMLVGAVNGSPVRVLVDSGAQFSAIDRGLADRLGLGSVLPLPILAYGVGGGPSVTHTVGFDLDLGALRVDRVRAAVLDLAAISETGGVGRERYGGVAGHVVGRFAGAVLCSAQAAVSCRVVVRGAGAAARRPGGGGVSR